MARHKHTSPVVRPLIKFSIYGVLCLILLGVLAAQVGNIRSLPFFGHQHSYTAELADASSLVAPDDVKIAGVTVGQVKGVKVKQGHAVVHFSIDDNIHLRASTQVGMRFQNVIGAKFLYLYPGSSGDVLRPGATIPLSHDVGSADVGDFLTDVGAFLKALNPNDVNTFTEAIVAALQDNDVQINQLIANTATVSGSVGALDTHIASVIDNLEQVLAALAARNSDLVSLTDHLASVSQQLAARNDVLDSLVNNFSQVNGDLNALLGTNRGNLDQAIANLQKIAGVLAQHRADLDKDLATFSSGFAPYTLISAFGQWFEIRVVYTCLARQTTCTYDTPTSGGAMPGPSPGPTARTGADPPGPRPGDPTVANILGFAVAGRAGS